MTRDENQACAVPLIERLRNVPEKARFQLDVGKYETRYWPVGALCHEAADALAAALSSATPAGVGLTDDQIKHEPLFMRGYDAGMKDARNSYEAHYDSHAAPPVVVNTPVPDIDALIGKNVWFQRPEVVSIVKAALATAPARDGSEPMPADAGAQEEAYWQGWCEAADWAKRDDLYADRDSQSYRDAMRRRLASPPPQSAPQDAQPVDAGAGGGGEGVRNHARPPQRLRCSKSYPRSRRFWCGEGGGSVSQNYELVTISDLLAVPMEKREACLRDLLMALALADLTLAEDGRAAAKLWTWTDDGDPSCSININGDEALSLKITDAE